MTEVEWIKGRVDKHKVSTTVEPARGFHVVDVGYGSWWCCHFCPSWGTAAKRDAVTMYGYRRHEAGVRHQRALVKAAAA